MTGTLSGVPTPTTQYARSDGLNIAYQVFGAGPPDVVLVPGFISHVEFAWHEPLLARFLRKLSAFTRVIAFDKRGMGLSDRDPRRETPSLAERMNDIAAVMHAAGSPRAALLAWSEGGPASLLFAQRTPERVAALMLIGTTPRFSAAEDYPEGIPRDMLELFIDTMCQEVAIHDQRQLRPSAAVRRNSGHNPKQPPALRNPPGTCCAGPGSAPGIDVLVQVEDVAWVVGALHSD